MALFYYSLASQPSPDGSALVGGLWLQAQIPAPSPPAPTFRPDNCITQVYTPHGSPQCPSTVIPYPDKALATVAGVVEQGVRFDNGGATQWYPASVAWRSDGKLLAVLLPADGFETDGSAARVTVYSASTGAIVAHFTAARAVTGTNLEPGGVSPVQWSPSGQQIALVDWASSAITVWDARSLRA